MFEDANVQKLEAQIHEIQLTKPQILFLNSMS